MSTKKQFVEVTRREFNDLEEKFIERLESLGGKGVVTAYNELAFLRMAAESGVTEMGQSYVTKARNQLKKFLGV